MSFATKYRCEFSSPTNLDYRLDIQVDGWTGGITNLIGAASPVVHKWSSDDFMDPVKGCSIDFTYINTGLYPIDLFYSDADNTFKGVFTCTTTNETLFIGFLIQDDCSEAQLDYAHEIKLTFSDGLGLLKNIKIGDGIDLLVKKRTLLELIFNFLLQTSLNLDIHILSELIEVNELNGYMFNPNVCFIEKTFIDVNVFSDTSNIYDTLKTIMGRFKLVLFQSKGQWYIINPSEVVNYQTSTFNSYKYVNGVYTSRVAMPSVYPIDNIDTYFTNKVVGTIKRPLKYADETMNYISVESIKNLDLKILGSFIQRIDRTTYWEDQYNFPLNSWSNIYTSQACISVDTDKGTSNELGRYVVLKGPNMTGLNRNSAIEIPAFEISKGDRFNFSFNLKEYIPGSTTTLYQTTCVGVWLKTGPTSYYSLYGGDLVINPSYPKSLTWMTTPKSNIDYTDFGTPATDANEIIRFGCFLGDLNTFDLNSISGVGKIPEVPYDGQIIIRIYVIDQPNVYNGGRQRKLWSFAFSTTQNVNNSVKIIGHKHKDSQVNQIKNISEKTITLDDTPRNTIKGTLLLPYTVNDIHVKTSIWTEHKDQAAYSGGDTYWQAGANTLIVGTGTLAGSISFAVNDFIFFVSSNYPDSDRNGKFKIISVSLASGFYTLGLDRTFTTGSIFPFYDPGYIIKIQGLGVGKLGYITTGNTLYLNNESRKKLDVSMYGLANGVQHISLINLMTTNYYDSPLIYFIWGILEINYRMSNLTGTLFELYKSGEDKKNLVQTYDFNYIYKTD